MKLSDLRSFLASAENRRRLVMAVLGTVVCALAVSMNRMANFGVDLSLIHI